MAESFDRIATDLQDLRARAGHPSYAEIVATIARHREAEGTPAFAARPGRTTVYDAFRTGRRRVDPGLVGEIARALGVDEAGVGAWEKRCREARRTTEAPRPTTRPSTQTPIQTSADPTTQTSAEPPAETSAEPPARSGTLPSPAPGFDSPSPDGPPVDSPVGIPAPRPDTPLVASVPVGASASAHGSGVRPRTRQRRSLRSMVAIMLGCIAVNLLGRALVDFLDMALFLDMTGTAAAAIALGPWWGATVGLASNLLGTTVSGSESIPFALVNVVGALVWGYGARSRRFTRSLPSFVGLNVLVALVCTMTAVPIVLALGAGLGHGTSRMADVVTSLGPSLFVALYSTNLVMSLADKLICGMVALTVVEFLPGRSLIQQMTTSAMVGGRTAPAAPAAPAAWLPDRITDPVRGGLGPPPGPRRSDR